MSSSSMNVATDTPRWRLKAARSDTGLERERKPTCWWAGVERAANDDGYVNVRKCRIPHVNRGSGAL